MLDNVCRNSLLVSSQHHTARQHSYMHRTQKSLHLLKHSYLVQYLITCEQVSDEVPPSHHSGLVNLHIVVL